MIKKISLILLLALIISVNSVISQETETQTEVATPVEDAFACTMLIDNQTISQPKKKSKEFIIHHRIGTIKSISDLFGVFGPANARLGMNFGITDKIMIGAGTEKFNKMQELMWKVSLLQQKDKGTPVFISYFGNCVVDGRNKIYFGDDYKFVDRLSFFNQIIIARKLSEKLSLQVAPYFLHFNKVDSIYSNEAYGVNLGGRFKIWNEISFLGEFNFTKPSENDAYESYKFGFEKNTGTHAFQLFVTNSNNIIPQKIYMFGQQKLGDESSNLKIGFNITVRF